MTDWTDAACRGEEPDLFFPIGNTGPAIAQIEAARRVCGGCAIRERCLDWAMERRIGEGIWGGCTEGERLSMRRRGLRGTTPPAVRFYVDAGPSIRIVEAARRDGWTINAIRVATRLSADTIVGLMQHSVSRITAESARRLAEADLSPAVKPVPRTKATVEADLDDESVSA